MYDQMDQTSADFRAETVRRNRDAHSYWVLRELIHALKCDISNMTTAAEHNGEWEAAEVLTNIWQRLADMDPGTVARLAHERAEQYKINPKPFEEE
jgi:hypothetical protein